MVSSLSSTTVLIFAWLWSVCFYQSSTVVAFLSVYRVPWHTQSRGAIGSSSSSSGHRFLTRPTFVRSSTKSSDSSSPLDDSTSSTSSSTTAFANETLSSSLLNDTVATTFTSQPQNVSTSTTSTTTTTTTTTAAAAVASLHSNLTTTTTNATSNITTLDQTNSTNITRYEAEHNIVCIYGWSGQGFLFNLTENPNMTIFVDPQFLDLRSGDDDDDDDNDGYDPFFERRLSTDALHAKKINTTASNYDWDGMVRYLALNNNNKEKEEEMDPDSQIKDNPLDDPDIEVGLTYEENANTFRPEDLELEYNDTSTESSVNISLLFDYLASHPDETYDCRDFTEIEQVQQEAFQRAVMKLYPNEFPDEDSTSYLPIRWIDLGSGDGTLGYLLSKLFPNSTGIFVDMSNRMLDTTHSLMHDTYGNRATFIRSFISSENWVQDVKDTLAGNLTTYDADARARAASVGVREDLNISSMPNDVIPAVNHTSVGNDTLASENSTTFGNDTTTFGNDMNMEESSDPQIGPPEILTDPMGAFDLIVSPYAVQKLDAARKKAIYKEIYQFLKPGGTFLNLDERYEEHHLHPHFMKMLSSMLLRGPGDDGEMKQNTEIANEYVETKRDESNMGIRVLRRDEMENMTAAEIEAYERDEEFYGLDDETEDETKDETEVDMEDEMNTTVIENNESADENIEMENTTISVIENNATDGNIEMNETSKDDVDETAAAMKPKTTEIYGLENIETDIINLQERIADEKFLKEYEKSLQIPETEQEFYDQLYDDSEMYYIPHPNTTTEEYCEWLQEAGYNKIQTFAEGNAFSIYGGTKPL